MYQIIINDVVLDGIVPGQDIAVSKALNNLNDIQSRQGAFSTEIKVRKTANNKSIFKSAHIVGSPTNIPYTRMVARVDEDGITQIYGFAQLERTEENYVFRIYGTSADFFNLIKDKPLNTLNLSRFDHFWTSQSIADNRAFYTGWIDGVIYPDIDYGKWTQSSATSAKGPDFYPAVYVKMIIYQMCLDCSFVPSGDFWDNDPLLAAEILPFSNVSPKYSKLANQDLTLTMVQTGFSISIPHLTSTILKLNYHSNNWGTYNATTGKLTVPERVFDLNVEISINYFISVLSLSFFPLIIILGKTNAGTFINQTIPSPTTWTMGGYNGNFKFILNAGQALNIKGSDVWFEIYIDDSLNPYSVFRIDFGSYMHYQRGDNAYHGGPWNVASNLPDLTCGDLLMTVANQFGLLIDANSQTKDVVFKPIKMLEANKANAVDWSDKVCLDSDNRINYLFNKYGQRSEMRYLYDENDPFLKPIPEYGNGYFQIDNKILDPKLVVFESKFAPVYRVNSFINSGSPKVIAFIGMFQPSDPTISITPKPRIAYLKKVEDNGDNSVVLNEDRSEDNANYIYGNGGGAAVHNAYTLGVFFDNIRFKEYLLSNYYQPLESILNQTKYLRIAINLSTFDFSVIDFIVPVWIDCYLPDFGQIRGYFYINNIDQYNFNVSSPTMVELVRL